MYVTRQSALVLHPTASLEVSVLFATVYTCSPSILVLFLIVILLVTPQHEGDHLTLSFKSIVGIELSLHF